MNYRGRKWDLAEITTTECDVYLPVELIQKIWHLLELDSILEAQIRFWDHINEDITPEEEGPIDRQQPFEQFIDPVAGEVQDPNLAYWGQWGYDLPREAPTGPWDPNQPAPPPWGIPHPLLLPDEALLQPDLIPLQEQEEVPVRELMRYLKAPKSPQ